MGLFKSISGALDSNVTQFTSLLQRKVNPLGIAPHGSGQARLYQMGLSAAGASLSPERTLALILKEWVKVRGMKTDSQMSLLEWRVFSKNFWPGYPEFSRLNDWLKWRLEVEFPSHSFRVTDGWTDEFFDWAKERAIERFA